MTSREHWHLQFSGPDERNRIDRRSDPDALIHFQTEDSLTVPGDAQGTPVLRDDDIWKARPYRSP